MSAFSVFTNSLKLTLQELRVNKTRTALSLTGVAFGIFCIIGVLATVNSLEQNIQNEVAGLGSNTIYIDKWDYSGGPDQPWWKMRARPNIKFEEAGLMRERSYLLEDVAYFMSAGSSVSRGNDQMPIVAVYGVNPEQYVIQPVETGAGRLISANEFQQGSAIAVIGFTIAEEIFGSSEKAIGKTLDLKGRKITVIGVLKLEGTNFVGWNYDLCVMIPYRYCKQIFPEENSNPILIAKGKNGVKTDDLYQELRGIMRQIRRLSPRREDNFSLNSVEAFSQAISGFFGLLNAIGAFIGGISLVVGLFGIANIMFVTVKERTSVIGLKKAIGAKKSTILLEFLAEAAIMCIFGGIIGLFFVWLLTLVLSGPLDFPVYISVPLLIATFVICLVVGLLAGFIPARQAARLDPVVAIRS